MAKPARFIAILGWLSLGLTGCRPGATGAASLEELQRAVQSAHTHRDVPTLVAEFMDPGSLEEARAGAVEFLGPALDSLPVAQAQVKIIEAREMEPGAMDPGNGSAGRPLKWAHPPSHWISVSVVTGDPRGTPLASQHEQNVKLPVCEVKGRWFIAGTVYAD